MLEDSTDRVENEERRERERAKELSVCILRAYSDTILLRKTPLGL